MCLKLIGAPKTAQQDPKKGLEGLKRGSIKNKRCGYTSKIKVKSKLLVYVSRSQKSF